HWYYVCISVGSLRSGHDAVEFHQFYLKILQNNKARSKAKPAACYYSTWAGQKTVKGKYVVDDGRKGAVECFMCCGERKNWIYAYSEEQIYGSTL
ncbi:hypothetical protein STEG23_024665, partial [Scotinomys teguina]